MGKYLVFIFALTVLVAVPAGGVRGAALVRDLSEAAYGGEVLEADQTGGILSTAAETQTEDVMPAVNSSKTTGSVDSVVQ